MSRRDPLRLRMALLCALMTCLLVGGGSTAASAAARSSSSATAAKAHKKPPRRVGGKVHHAWPNGRGAPKSSLARWLARQVGPTKVKPCRRKVHGRTVACKRKKPPRKSTLPPGFRGQLARADGIDPSIDFMPDASTTSTGSSTLALVRSFSIPTDDPSYARLLNWSWTYDSAMTAAAFAAAGDTSEAQQLIDQLSALQHTDGSIEIAFNVSTGEAESTFRSGTIAAVGLAGSLFDQYARSSRYLAMQERTAAYLLTLQGSNGLVRGGPDVSWYSTQHNLLAYAFLVRLGNEALAGGDRTHATTYYTAAFKIAAAINTLLLVQQGSTAYFIEGLNDGVRALDTEALGIMYLQSLGQTSLASEVSAYTQSALGVSGRSITTSNTPATYNMTYSAHGPFSGFEPFAGANAPDVLWPEGSAEMLLAQSTIGQSTTTLTASINSIAALTSGSGGAPLQADRTVTSVPYGVEFHVWPAAAAGAWVVLAEHKPTVALFPAATS
jgi:hypothetical protein